jgi:hypothetical protein
VSDVSRAKLAGILENLEFWGTPVQEVHQVEGAVRVKATYPEALANLIISAVEVRSGPADGMNKVERLARDLIGIPESL